MANTLPPVKHWTSADGQTRHAECLELMFTAFPEQSFLADGVRGPFGAVISPLEPHTVRIYFRDSRREPTVAYRLFDTLDEAVRWTAAELVRRSLPLRGVEMTPIQLDAFLNYLTAEIVDAKIKAGTWMKTATLSHLRAQCGLSHQAAEAALEHWIQGA